MSWRTRAISEVPTCSACLTAGKYSWMPGGSARLKMRRRAQRRFLQRSKQSQTLRRLCRGLARSGDLERDRSARKKIARRDRARPEVKVTLAAYDRIKKAQEEIAKIAPRYDYFEEVRGRSASVIARRALSTARYSNMRGCSPVRSMSEPNQTANVSRHFATAQGVTGAGTFLQRAGLR